MDLSYLFYRYPFYSIAIIDGMKVIKNIMLEKAQEIM